jgi:hypothetical protein
VLANDAGEFTVAPPFTYSSGVVVPPNPKAHSTQLLFIFDLLTETAPGSCIYARQTVLDTLNIGYAKPGAPTATPPHDPKAAAPTTPGSAPCPGGPNPAAKPDTGA